MIVIARAVAAIIVLLLLGIGGSHAVPTHQRRATAPVVAAPSGWKVSWNKAGRLSNGASTQFMGLFTVDATAAAVTQAHVQSCVSRCSTTSKCAFVNLLKLTGSSKGNVVCMMFPKYFASTGATYTNGPQSSGGTVDYSYGIRSLCTPTNGGALTCSPAQVPTTTTSAPPVATATRPTGPWTYPTDTTLPAAPAGATLIQWAPCSSTQLVSPAMANAAFLSGSSANTAYLVQHGTGSDFDAIFTALRNVVGDAYPIIAPAIMTDDGSSPYYRRGVNLAWSAAYDTWSTGQDDTTGAGCSSYDIYDAIINYYVTSRFPNVQTIYFVGHSAGANMLSRFSVINNNTPRAMRYVVANAASQAFFTNPRPVSGSANCTGALSYPFQWTGSYPRYVANRVGGRSAAQLFSTWMSTSVTTLTGDQDVATTGTQACQSTLQGGPYRRDRNYAYWAYKNIIAGTSTDVSAYTGYAELKQEGAGVLVGGGALNHQHCTVPGVAHDQAPMFASDCGRGAILPGQSLPAGAGASYPSGFPV